MDWLPPPVSSVKLNFDRCFMGNPRQLGIVEVTRDHTSTVLRAYSKHLEVGLAIKAEILALLKGLQQAKALYLSNLSVEGDSAIVISYVSIRERLERFMGV